MAVGTVAVGLWIVGLTWGVNGIGWLVGDALLATGEPAPTWGWAVATWVVAVLAAAPAAVLALVARRMSAAVPGARAATLAWATAGVASGLVGTARIIPVVHNELLLAATALLATAAVVALRLLARRAARTPAPTPDGANPTSGASPTPGASPTSGASPTPGASPGDGVTPSPGADQSVGGRPGPARLTGFGLAAGLAVLVPWLWVGSLGGLTETVLAVAAAAAVGWLAATILGPLVVGFGRGRPWQVLVGGLAAGVALAPLAAATGGPGVHLALLAVVPAVGFAAAALAVASRPARPGRAALTALVGAAALGPLAFVDPEETTTLLGTDDIGAWTLIGALVAVPVAWAAGAVFGLVVRPGRRPSRWLTATVAAIVLVAGAAVYVLAGRPGLYGERLFVVLAEQADLSGLDTVAGRDQRVTATYRRLVDHAERTQAPLRRELDRWGLDYTPYYLVNALLVDAGPAVREWLSQRSDVDRVLIDQRLRPLPEPAPATRGERVSPPGPPLWNIRLINADRAWDELRATGRGIVIGSSDSGVDGTHPLVRPSFRGGDDSWYDPWNATGRPTDRNGHGTHTVGTAVGQFGVGVAPGAQWIGCVNLDRNLGSPSRYLECLQFMLAPFGRGGDALRDGRPARAAHVLTNSWGCPEIEGCDLDSLRPATAALRAAGIFMVAAAGNSGPGCGSVEDPPAPYEDVFTVGAVDRRGTVTSFSSRGPTPDGRPKPDVMAPGEDIYSALPGSTYASYAGTSMATPHVAGVVALMWSANPRLVGDIDTTARLLRETTRPALAGGAVTCGRPENLYGAGMVDAYNAVRAAIGLGAA
jgi:subtilisin family serine protease